MPKLDNYTKGELEIKIVPFGLDDPISVGKVTADGTIHFDFPDTHLGAPEESSHHPMGRAVGMFVCHDEEIEEHTETVAAIEVKDFFLYKYGQQVGALLHASDEEVSENELSDGSKISWFLSSGVGVFKATCTTYEDDGLGKGGLDKNNLRNKTSYDVSFEKGWNIVEYKLLETKKIELNGQEYTRRLIEEKRSVANIPANINWDLNYWANDESLEIEQRLIKETPVTKTQYENWVPKKLGKLKRKNYEVGKKLDRIPVLNNVHLVFEKGLQKVAVTIVDCAQDKNAASNFTMMRSMANSDWKDKTKTGYSTATKMDATRVIIDYNEKEIITKLTYNRSGRFVVLTEAKNMKPEALWELLKKLKIDDLVN